MDHVKQLCRFSSLVRLKPADGGKPEVGMAGQQRRPFGERFLDAILAEVALTGLDQRLYLLDGAALADRDELDVLGRTPRERRRTSDSLDDLFPSLSGVAHGVAL